MRRTYILYDAHLQYTRKISNFYLFSFCFVSQGNPRDEIFFPLQRNI